MLYVTELSDARAGNSPVRGAEECARAKQLVQIVQRLNAAAQRCSSGSAPPRCEVRESGFFDD